MGLWQYMARGPRSTHHGQARVPRELSDVSTFSVVIGSVHTAGSQNTGMPALLPLIHSYIAKRLALDNADATGYSGVARPTRLTFTQGGNRQGKKQLEKSQKRQTRSSNVLIATRSDGCSMLAHEQEGAVCRRLRRCRARTTMFGLSIGLRRPWTLGCLFLGRRKRRVP